jgi:hypothetical protein
MTSRRLPDETSRNRFDGSVEFLMPDGEPFRAECQARFARERWQGVLNIPGFTRGLEQGDVCRIFSRQLGELRIVIVEQVGTHRYQFIALVKPDPLETL